MSSGSVLHPSAAKATQMLAKSLEIADIVPLP
jgi:hypothetical protein